MHAESELTDEQLRSIYAWIDAIPLSRPKRNISRDFSDGVLIAEVIAAYFPQFVEMHNYASASNTQQKIYNLETLNQRVLKRFNYQIPRSTIEDIVSCKPGVVEHILNTLQYKMAKYREKKSERESAFAATPKSSPLESRADNITLISSEHNLKSPPQKPSNVKNNANGSGGKGTNSKNPIQVSVDEEILMEKEEQIRELQETVEVLELKISKLEQLVRIKDNKIQKLLSKQT